MATKSTTSNYDSSADHFGPQSPQYSIFDLIWIIWPRLRMRYWSEWVSSLPTVSHSLLDMLKAPTAAEINRKRKVKAKRPPVGKHRSTGSSVSNPKGIHPSKRVLKFSNEELKVSACKLFCSACPDNRWYMSPLAGRTVNERDIL